MRRLSIYAWKGPPQPTWSKSTADITEGKRHMFSGASSWNVIVFCSSNERFLCGRESLECRNRKWKYTHTEGCRDTSAVRHTEA